MPKPTTIFIEILRNFDDAQNCYIKVELQVKLVSAIVAKYAD
jgi:hypothetical protein